VLNDRLFAASVGDSRLYLLRQGQIRKLSTDHTWIQEALEAGVLEPDQAEGHPNAHVIRRYLGSPNPPQVDIRLRLDENETNAQAESNQGFNLLPGDYLLMCSDGLSDLVKDQEILDAIQTRPLNEAVSSLINLANERGGHDNITIIALQAAEKQVVEVPKTIPKRWVLGCAGAVLLAAVLAGIVWGAFWLSGKRLLPASATPGGALTELPGLPALTRTFASQGAGQSASSAATQVQETPKPVFPVALEKGNTLTPWPTDTFQPSSTMTVSAPETLNITVVPPVLTPES
jgi:hypothetical protein